MNTFQGKGFMSTVPIIIFPPGIAKPKLLRYSIAKGNVMEHPIKKIHFFPSITNLVKIKQRKGIAYKKY